MSSSSITVTAFGDVKIDLDICYDDDSYEIDGASINGYTFEWQDVSIGGVTFDDYVADQILDELDAVGWAKGQADCDRADARRKET